MTVVSAVSEKPKPVLATQSSQSCQATPDVAFVGTQQGSPCHPVDTDDTTAFFKDVERTARNEVQV